MTLPSLKYNRCLAQHSVIVSSAMNNAMSNKLLMFTWENSPSAASVIGRDRLRMQLHICLHHRLHPRILR